MTLLLRIIPANGGKVISKKLKKSLTEVKLPAGAQFEVVDAATGQIVHAQRAVKADTSATIDYLQDGVLRQVHISDAFSQAGSLLGDFEGVFFDANNPAVYEALPVASSGGGGGSIGLILLGLAGLGGGAAAAAGGGGGSGGTPPPPPPPTQVPTATPALALGTGVSGGATSAEATANGGVVTVNAVSGATVLVTFTNGTHAVTKTVTGTGAAQAVVLTAADLTTLGDGAVSVSATATASGQSASSAATSSFTLDTVAPTAPVLALGAGFTGGATAAEAAAAAGAVTVSGETGSSIVVTFTDAAGHVVSKSLTGTGSAQAVVLSGADVSALNDGQIRVNAVATDSAGNASPAGTASFTLDTVAPVAPVITLGAGVAGGATAAEAAAAGGVVTITAEAGSAVVVTLSNGSDEITRTMTGTGAAQILRLSNLDVLLLGDGPVNVSAVATDSAGNIGTTGTSTFTIDSVAPNGLQMFPATNIAGGATSAEAESATGLVTVIGEAGSAIQVTFTDASGQTVVKTLTGTGGLQAVALTAAELATLSDGTINALGTIRDAAGNVGAPSYANIILDTTAPTVSIGTIAVDDVINAVEHGTGLVISGATTAENGQVVTVSLNGNSYAGIASGGVWSVAVGASDVSALTQAHGAYTVTASVSDAAGNASGQASHTINVDTSAPAVAITSGALTGSTTPVVSGTAEAGASVTVSVAGATYTTTATGGVWSVNTATATPASGTLSLNANGSNAVSVVAADAAGNTASASQSLVIDTTAPSVAITSGALTNNTHPVVSGTAEAGASVSVVIGGATYTTVATGGVWSVNTNTATPASGTLSLNANGANTVTATARDAAGNPTSASQSLVVDTTAPTVSIGTIAVDDVINAVEHGTGLVISGATTAENGQVVTVSLNGNSYAGIASGGVWSVAVGASDVSALSAASYQVDASVADVAGNQGNASARALSLDLAAPTAPVITGISDDTGTVGDHITSGTNQIISGTAEALATLTVYDGATVIGTTTADNTGAWSFDYQATTLADGSTHSFTVKATDAAGNDSLVSVPYAVTVDTTAPGVPNLEVNYISGNNGFTNNTGLSFYVLAAADAQTVTIYDGNTPIGTASPYFNFQFNGQTYWAFDNTAPLADGSVHNFTAIVTDAAGNQSQPTPVQTVTIDTTQPSDPVVVSVSVDSGVVGDHLTNDNTLAISGTAEANSTVTVFLQGVTWTTVQADGNGNWTADFSSTALTDGYTYTFVAQSYDAAHNYSGSTNYAVTIDQSINAPIITGISPDNGVAGDGVTNATVLTISGTAEANSTVSLYDGSFLLGTVTADSNGHWFLADGRTLADGATPLYVAVAADIAGNTSASSNAYGVLVDTTPPALTIDTIAHDDVLNAAEHGTALVISGTTSAENGQVVTVTLNNHVYTAVAAGGVWSAVVGSTDVATLANGQSFAVTADVQDLAGNPAQTVLHSIDIDTTAPNAPLVDPVTANNIIDASEAQASVTLSGTGEAGATVELTFSSGETMSAVVQSDGTWSVGLSTAEILAFGAGGESVAVTQTNLHGNTSAIGSREFVVQIDLTDSAANLLNNQLVASATNITVTGTTSLADLQALQALTNPGQTVFETVAIAPVDIGSIVLSGTDRIQTLTITAAADAAGATAVVALLNGGAVAHADYSLDDTVAAILGASPDVINHAADINATGSATAAQANTLLAAANTGSTTIETVDATVGEAAALALGATDHITNLYVTVGVFGPAIVNLTNIPFQTNITVDGSAGTVAETIYAPTPKMADITSADATGGLTAGTALAGTLDLTGGSSSDTFVISDTNTAGGLPIVTSYAGGNMDGGAGGDTLVVVGTVDLTALTITSIENLRAVPGSPSNVILTPTQLRQFLSINGTATAGADSTTITIKDLTGAGQVSDADVVATGTQFQNVAAIYVGVNTNLIISVGDLPRLGTIGTGVATIAGDSNGKITPVIPTGGLHSDLDLTQYYFSFDLTTLPNLAVDLATGQLVDTSTGYHIILPTLSAGQSITLLASQLEPWNGGQGGTTQFFLGTSDGTGKITVIDDLPSPTTDLTNVDPTIAKILSLSATSDLSTQHTLVGSLDEIQLNGHSLTVDVNDLSGSRIGGAGDLTVVGTVQNGPIDLSQLSVAAHHFIDLTQISGAITLPQAVGADVELRLLDSQFAGGGSAQVIQNDGTVTVYSDILSPQLIAPDFSGITTGQSALLNYEISHNRTLDTGTNLNGADVTIHGQHSVSVDANVASGIAFDGSVAGDGALTVTGTANGNLDFANIGTHLGSADLSAISLGTNTVTLPVTVPAGQTLNLNTEEANGQTIANSGTLTVVTVVEPNQATLDLSGLTGQVTFNISHLPNANSSYISIDLGTVQTVVDGGETFELSINDASGHDIGGNGAVRLLGAQDQTHVLIDLSTISVYSYWARYADTTFAGNLGTTVVYLNNGVTFTTDAETASGITFTSQGTGLSTLHLTGHYTRAVDLQHASTNIDITGSSVNDNVAGLLPTFVPGQTLTLTYPQAHGLHTIDVGAGTAEIVNISFKADADLSGITASGGGQVIAAVENDKTFTGDFGVAEVKILNASVLTVAAGKIGTSGRLVYGVPTSTAGRLNLTDDSSGALTGSVSLSRVSVSIDLTAITAGLAVNLNHNMSSGPNEVTFGTLQSGQTVYVEARQVTGGALHIDGNAGSTLDIIGDRAGSINLELLGDDVTLSFADSSSDQNPAIDLAVGEKLTAKAIHLDGQTVTETGGTVVLLDNSISVLGHDINLTHVTADIDLSHLSSLYVDSNTNQLRDTSGSLNFGRLISGQALIVNSDQITYNEFALHGDAGSSLVIQNDITAPVSLLSVDSAIAISFADSADGGTPTVQLDGAYLAMRAVQANGQNITSAIVQGSNTGTVIIQDDGQGGALSASTNLAAITANIDLTNLSGLAVDGASTNLSDGTHDVQFGPLQNGQTLAVTAAQVSGPGALTLYGTGGSVLDIQHDITRDVSLLNVDDAITISFLDNADGGTPTVQLDDATLTLRAVQANGQNITSATVGGANTGAIVLHDDGSTGPLYGSVNLSGITANIDLTNLSALTVDQSNKLANGGNSITFGPLDSSQTIVVDAAQVTAHALELSGNGMLDIVNDIATDTDLSLLGDNVRLSFADSASDSAPAVALNTGVTLFAKALHLDGQTVTTDAGMTGEVVVLDNSDQTPVLGGSFNLSGLATDIDLTQLQGLNALTDNKFGDASGTITLPSLIAGQTVTVYGWQLEGDVYLSGDVGSQLQVLGDITASASIADIGSDVDVAFPNNAVLVDGATLTARADQISAFTVTSAVDQNQANTGTLAVADNGDGHISYKTDLLAVSANIDLSQLADVTVNNGVSLGYLNDGSGLVLLPTLASGQTLTMTAAQAHGGSINGRTAGLLLNGTGSLVLTGNLAGDVDLTTVAPAIAVTIDGANVVGASLILTAAQADHNTITSDANTGRVVVEGIPAAQALTVAQLHAGLAAANLPVTSNIADTAAHLAAADYADLHAVLPNYATITATTAATVSQATTFADAAAGHDFVDLNIHYAIQDTAAALAASSDAVLSLATSITASTAATAAQALVLAGFANSAVHYAVNDTPAAIAAALTAAVTADPAHGAATLDSALAAASSFTLNGVATFAQASQLSDLNTISSYAITDTAANVHALLVANNGSTSFLSKASSLTITGSLTAADAKTIVTAAGTYTGLVLSIDSIADTASAYQFSFGNNSPLPNAVHGLTLTSAATVATAPATGAINSLSDTAANIANASNQLLSRVAGLIAVRDGATIAQAQTIAVHEKTYNSPNGISVIFSVFDTATNIANLLSTSYQNLPNFVQGTFNASTVATAAEAAKIARLATTYSTKTFNFSVQDTSANILGSLTNSLMNKVTGSVTITGTVTAAEALSLLTYTRSLSYNIRDSIANIEAAITSSGGKNFLTKATNITVTDTVTVQQATDVTDGVSNTGTTTFANLSDANTAIVGASSGLLAHVTGTITATATAAEDLSNVTANLDLTRMTGLGTNASGKIQMSGVSSRDANGVATVTTYTVTLPSNLAAGRTLYVTAAHLAGAHGLTLGSSGGTAYINIANDITASTNLLGLAASIGVAFVDGTVDAVGLSGAAVVLDAYENQVNGKTITGSGTVAIHGRDSGANSLEALASNSGALDIRGISANIDLTNLDLTVDSNGILSDAGGYILSSGANGALVLIGGQTLSLTQSELFGSNQLLVSGTGVIDIRGNITDSIDLTYLAGASGVTLSFLDPSETGRLGSVDVTGASAPITLSLTASQASGQVITGSNSTIAVKASAVSGTNLAAATDLSQVASTLFKTGTAWATFMSANTSVSNGTITGNADGTITLTSSGVNGQTSSWNFFAPVAGIYTFTYKYKDNNYGTTTTNIGSSIDGANIAVPYAYNNREFFGGYSNYYGWFSYQDVYVANNDGIVTGSVTISMAAGSRLYFQINQYGDRTAGPDGYRSAPDTITLSNGGFSAIGGTSQQLLVDVATSTDLTSTSATAPLNFASVDNFKLRNSGTVLKMTTLQASSHVVSSVDGYGSVLISDNANTGFIDLTKIAVPIAFTNNAINVNSSRLFLLPEQANGLTIGGGNLYITGPVADGHRIDLTRSSATVYTVTTPSQDPGGPTAIALGRGSALIMTSGQIYGRQVSNVDNATPGTLYVVGDIGGNSSLDLRNVTANLSFYDGVTNALVTVAGTNGSVQEGQLVTRTTTESGPLGQIGMGGNANLYINGSQLAGQSVIGAGSNRVYVFSTVPNGADYSHIGASIDLTNATVHRTTDANDSRYYNLDLTAPTWNSDQVLTLNTNQAANLYIDVAAGQVLVTHVENAPSADYTQIHASAVTLEFSGSTTFTGNFGTTQVLIDQGVQITMGGSIASGVTFDGLVPNGDGRGGGLAISGITGLTDLTKTVNTPTIPFAGVHGWVDVNLAYAVTGGANLLGGNDANAVSWNAATGYFENAAGDKVILPTFNGNFLTVAFSQLSGNEPIALSGTGLIDIKGAITRDLDITAWSRNFKIRFGNSADAYNEVYRYHYYNGGIQTFTSTIDANATLTMAADQTYYFNRNYGGNLANTFEGAGTVLIKGGFDVADVRLDGWYSGISTNIDLRQLGGTAAQVHLSGNNISYNNGAHYVYFPYQLGFGSGAQTVYVLASQIAGTAGLRLDSASGNKPSTLNVTGNVDAGYYSNNLNLLNINPYISLVFNGNNTLNVAGGNTLSMRLDQAAQLAVSGTGSVVFGYVGGNYSSSNAMQYVTLANSGPSVDLSQYQTSLDFIALSSAGSFTGLTLNNANKLSDATTGKYIDLPSLISGQTIKLTTKQIAGQIEIQSTTGGTVNVQGNVTAATGAVDLTGIAAGIAIDFNDAADSAANVIKVLGSTMTIRPDQASGQIIQSDQSIKTGNVILTGGALSASGTDLSNVSANIDITTMTNIVINGAGNISDGTGYVNAYALQYGQTFKASASQLTGNALVLGGVGGSTLNVKGNISGLGNSVDLSQVDESVSVSFADQGESTATITVADTSLTMKAIQATGKTIAGDGTNASSRNTGTLVVVDNATGNITSSATGALVTTLNLANVSTNIDLSNLAGLHYVTASSAFKDSAGTVTLPTLAAYQSLSLNAAQLAGAPVLAGVAGAELKLVGNYGNGDSDVRADTDLTGVSDNITVTFDGSNGILGVFDSTLTLKAGQVNGKIILGGVTYSNDAGSYFANGTVLVKYNSLTGHLDTASLDLSNVFVNLNLTELSNLTVNNSGVLEDVNGGTIGLPGNFGGTPLFVQTISLTSEQLAGGALVLNRSSAAQNLTTLDIWHDIGNDVDLSGLADGVKVVFSHDTGTDVSITGAFKLTAKSFAISGRTITSVKDSGGAYLGTVAVADMSDHHLGGTLDLRNVSANLDLSLLENMVVNASGTLEEVGTGDTIQFNQLVAGQSLTLAASLLTGNTLALTGQTGSYLNITGDLAQAGTIDLTAVSGASISFYDAANPDIKLTSGGALKLTAALADGLIVTSDSSGTKTGRLILAGNLVSGRSISLGGVTANIDLTQALNLTVNNSGLFASTLSGNSGTIAALSLIADQTLIVGSAQLDGGAIDLHGSTGGTLWVQGNITNNIDLSDVGDALALQLDNNAQISGATLTLRVAQASGISLTSHVTGSNLDGTVVLKGALNSHADIRGLGTNVDITQMAVVAEGSQLNTLIDGNGHLLYVGYMRDTAQSLYATAAQADGLVLMGETNGGGAAGTWGTLVLENDSNGDALTGNVSLAGVRTNIDLTHLGVTIAGSNNNDLAYNGSHLTLGQLASGQTVTVNVAQIESGVWNVDAVSGSTVSVAGDVTLGGSLDLRGINADATISFADAADPNGASAIDIGDMASLVMWANQASGLTITGTGYASFISAGGSLALDLSNVTVANSALGLDGDTILSAVGGNAAATVLGQSSTEVYLFGYELTVDAAIVSGHYVNGYGNSSLVLTGNADDVDFSNFNVGALDVTGVVAGNGTNGLVGNLGLFRPVNGQTYTEATVINGTLLYLTAEQLSGQSIVSSGGEAMVLAHVATAYDFSHLAPLASTTFLTGAGLTLVFQEAGTIDSGVDLHGFTAIDLHAGTTQVSALQADGIVWSGAGGLEIVNADAHQTPYALSGTGFGDTVHGHASNDIVDISQGGDDTLAFSNLASGNGATAATTHADFGSVTGFAMDSGYVDYVASYDVNTQTFANPLVLQNNGDKLDFSALTGQQSGLTLDHIQLGNLPGSIADHQLLVFDDFAVANASGIQNLFGSRAFNLNAKLVSGTASEEFLMFSDGNGAAKVWHWQDAGTNDHKIQAGELTLLGTINGLTIDDGVNPIGANDLSFLHQSQIIG